MTITVGAELRSRPGRREEFAHAHPPLRPV